MHEGLKCSDVTALILTYNEEPNIARTLAALGWVGQIVVIDSGSTDATIGLVQAMPNATLVFRQFDDFASQWNFGLQRVETPWVLTLDADYVLSPELVREVASLDVDDATSGLEARFVYWVNGRPLRAALYPPRVVLFRRERATYFNEGHTQRLRIDGIVRRLQGAIFHDDRKPISRWFAAQQRYARDEAEYLLTMPTGQLRTTERLRRLGWAAPALVFVYTLLVKRCLLDGWPGWLYVLQRTLSEIMIAIEICDRKLRK